MSLVFERKTMGKVNIVKSFNNIVDALNYAEEIKKCKNVLSEPKVIVKYVRHVCDAKVIFSVK